MMGFWARMCLRCSLTRVRLIGAANIPAAGGMVIAANHSSFIDNLVLLGELPLRFKIVASRAGFSLPFMGRVYRGAGYIPTGLRMDLSEQMKLYRELKNKRNVLIYSKLPKNSKLGEFTEAMIAAARETHCPIVPISIKHAREVLPMKKFILKKGEIVVRIGEPIYVPDLKILQDKIRELYQAEEGAFRA